MIDFISELSGTCLFSGIDTERIAGLLECVGARLSQFKRGGLIIQEGDEVCDFGIVLSGRGRVMKTDPSGKVLIITLLEKGSEIGILIAASRDRVSPVTVQATEDLELLSVPFDRVLERCGKNCPWHAQMIHNCISMVADKGLELHNRIDCLLKVTLRGKIMTYLDQTACDLNARSFDSPLDRNGMADYLGVDRSALSRELSAMKKDGFIDYHKNHFKLY